MSKIIKLDTQLLKLIYLPYLTTPQEKQDPKEGWDIYCNLIFIDIRYLCMIDILVGPLEYIIL